MPTTHLKNNFENANLLSSEEHKVNLKVIHSEKVKKKQDRNKFLERISKNCLTKKDYMINLKSELEIRMLHEKIDHLIMHQQQELIEIQKVQIEMMNDILTRIK